MNKTVFITGATSGIGKATAELLAKAKFNLILCGRREERLKVLQKELVIKTNILTLNFDIRDKIAVQKAFDNLPKDFSQIDVLINNAGNAHGLDTIDEGSIEDWDAMLDIMLRVYFISLKQ